MLPSHLLVYPGMIVRAGTQTDRYGAEVEDWSESAVTRHAVRGWLWQNTGTEDNNDRSAQIAGYQYLMPPGTDVTGADRIEIDGTSYQVEGKPLVRRTPDGPHHIEARLRTIEG